MTLVLRKNLFVSNTSQKLLKNILSLCKDCPVMLLMSLGWNLGLLGLYVPIMQVKTDFFEMQFLALWVHDTRSLKPDLLLPLHFLLFLLLAWLASTVCWTCFPMAVKPPDGTLPASHKLEQERCIRHWNSLRFRFIGITINSVRWGGSLCTSGMQIRLCCSYFFS